MKNVLKIVTIASCLTSLYQANVAAAEDAILREQQEISNRVRRVSELESPQNWQAYTSAQETLHKQKISRQEQNRKNGKQEAKKKALKSERDSHFTTGILGWYSNNDRLNIKYSEAKQIKQLENGGWLYAYIHPKLTAPQWENALGKGVAEGAIGHNGIKLLKSVVELKINGGQRLYTTKLYQNDQGDYIAILDQEGNHKEVARKARETTLKIINDIPSTPQKK
jgi:hypothetical protein